MFRFGRIVSVKIYVKFMKGNLKSSMIVKTI